MSRSKRKTPIYRITSPISRKKIKRLANRKYRRQIQMTLMAKQADAVLPIMKGIGDPWEWTEDGPYYWGKDAHPADMRK